MIPEAEISNKEHSDKDFVFVLDDKVGFVGLAFKKMDALQNTDLALNGCLSCPPSFDP